MYVDGSTSVLQMLKQLQAFDPVQTPEHQRGQVRLVSEGDQVWTLSCITECRSVQISCRWIQEAAAAVRYLMFGVAADLH